MKPATETSAATRVSRLGLYVLSEAGRKRVLLALGFLILGSFTEGVSILLLIPILQTIGSDTSTVVIHVPTKLLSSALGSELRFSLLSVLGLLVAVVFAQALFVRFKNIYMAEMLYDVINRLRVGLFDSIARARWQFIACVRGSDLHHGLTADIDRVQAATFRLLLLIQGLALLAVYLVVSWLISPPVTIFAFATGAGVLAVLQPIRRRASAYGRLITDNRQEQYRTVHEYLSGMKVAKSFNVEPRYSAELAATLIRMRGDFGRFVRLSSVSGVVFQTASAVVMAGFVYISLRFFSLSLPHLVVLLFVFMRVLPRFTSLQGDVQEMLVNLPAFDAMQELRSACDREREQTTSDGAPAPAFREEIRFAGVTFRYGPSDDGEILSDMNFTVPARRITAVIGPSGSGKSTIADMLMGLLAPDAGTIAIDGLVLDEANRRGWRGEVAYVPQDVFLLHDTIAANLRLGAPGASEDDLWTALRAAQAEAFVTRLPERLATTVGDRGVRLSGGERQRIALARALLRRPQLLILDEATSALDWENQAAIARSIEALRGSLTIVTIAHRLSMISFADWVVAIEEGKVAETGPYRDLIGVAGSRLARLVAGEGGRSG